MGTGGFKERKARRATMEEPLVKKEEGKWLREGEELIEGKKVLQERDL